MRNKYEYRLELDARSKAGAWGDQVRIKGMATHNISAGYINVTRDTIYKWISEKQMPAIRIGKKWLFRKKEIDIWLASSGHIQNQKYFSKEQ